MTSNNDFFLNVYTGWEGKFVLKRSTFSLVTRSLPSPPMSLSPGTKIACVLPLYTVVTLFNDRIQKLRYAYHKT